MSVSKEKIGDTDDELIDFVQQQISTTGASAETPYRLLEPLQPKAGSSNSRATAGRVKRSPAEITRKASLARPLRAELTSQRVHPIPTESMDGLNHSVSTTPRDTSEWEAGLVVLCVFRFSSPSRMARNVW
jgi:hypothetical protein